MWAAAPHNAGMISFGIFGNLSPAPRWALCLCGLMGLSACSREEPAACSPLNNRLDQHIVAAALLQQEGEVQDRSASQQAARVSLVHNHLLNIQNLLHQMDQHGCAPRPTPVDPEAYADASRNCYLSSVGASVSRLQDRPEAERLALRDKALAACTFDRWQAR